jgi:hypothetical protein
MPIITGCYVLSRWHGAFKQGKTTRNHPYLLFPRYHHLG